MRNTAATIAKLKEATSSQIADIGYGNLSLNTVSQQVGISKAAVFHHYRSKDHLVADAFAQMLENVADALVEAGEHLRDASCTRDEFLNTMIDQIGGRNFAACMEIATDIRHNQRLSKLIEDPITDWRNFLENYWFDLFDLPGQDEEEQRTHWELCANTLRGFGFRNVFLQSERDCLRMMNGLKSIFFTDAVLRPSVD